MKLFKFELKKILFNKRSVIVLAVLFAIYLGMSFGGSYSILGGAEGYAVYSELADAAAGPYDAQQAVISQEAVNTAIEKYGSADALIRLAWQYPDLPFHMSYVDYAASVDTYWNGSADGQDLDNIMGVYPLQEKLAALEAEGLTGTYDYNRYSTRLAAELSAGEPEYHNTVLWDSFLENCSGMVAIMLLFFPLAFLIAPVFTNERSSGMDNIILSSKNGQRKTVFAKIGAVAVTSILLCTLYVAGVFIGTFLPYGTLAGVGLSVRSLGGMAMSQLGMSIGGFAALSVLWLCFVAVVFGVFLTLVSSRSKRQISVFAIGLVLLLSNILISALGTSVAEALNVVLQFGFMNTAGAMTVFSGITSFNVLGLVVPYSTMVIIVLGVLSLAAVAGVAINQKRRTVA